MGNVDEVVRQAKVGFLVLSLAMALAGLAAAPALAQFGPEAADPLPDARGVVRCGLTPGVEDAAWPAGVPSVLVADFARLYGPYAAPGQAYSAAEGRPGPQRRVMMARHKGRRWVVVYEEGATAARARTVRLLLYSLEPSGEVKRLDSLTSFDGLLCRSSAAMLARFPGF